MYVIGGVIMKKVVITILVVIGIFTAIGIYAYSSVTVKDPKVRYFDFPKEDGRRYHERIDEGNGIYRWTEAFTALYEFSYEASAKLKGQITKGKITIVISNIADDGTTRGKQELVFEGPVAIDQTVTVKYLAGRCYMDVYYDDEVEGSFTADWDEKIRRFRKIFSPTNREE